MCVCVSEYVYIVVCASTLFPSKQHKWTVIESIFTKHKKKQTFLLATFIVMCEHNSVVLLGLFYFALMSKRIKSNEA